MNRRATGTVFCLIAALLYSVKYISAAIFGSNITSWNAGLFNAMLEYMGNGLNYISLLSLITGIIYLVIAELSESPNFLQKLKKRMD